LKLPGKHSLGAMLATPGQNIPIGQIIADRELGQKYPFGHGLKTKG
jgi:hypothetical protein